MIHAVLYAKPVHQIWWKFDNHPRNLDGMRQSSVQVNGICCQQVCKALYNLTKLCQFSWKTREIFSTCFLFLKISIQLKMNIKYECNITTAESSQPCLKQVQWRVFPFIFCEYEQDMVSVFFPYFRFFFSQEVKKVITELLRSAILNKDVHSNEG